MSLCRGAITACRRSLVIGVVAALLAACDGDPRDRIFGIGPLDKVDSDHIALSEASNQYLACPPDQCADATHAESPVFVQPVAALEARWRAMIALEPRVVVLGRDDSLRQHDYVQRSAVFRFPDIITVRFYDLDADGASLAVFSRALYGRADFGVNRERVEAWLARL